MFRVLFAPIIRSTTAAYSHMFCMVWCVYSIEQVLALWHGQLQSDRAKVLKLSQTSTCSNAITHQTIQNIWLYAAVVRLTMGANSARNM
jgi:hypothetical protein